MMIGALKTLQKIYQSTIVICIDIHKVDKMSDDIRHDIILANINRNIILDNIDALHQSTR
jgi:hypothetical protein